jgi:hypothetical protein
MRKRYFCNEITGHIAYIPAMRMLPLFLLPALGGCAKTEAPALPAPPASSAPVASFTLSAGITDIMKYQIDPSADALWDAVGTYVDQRGTVVRQPKSEQEWSAARGHAITIAEAANLLVMDGRRVSVAGHEVEDAGTPGNLNAAQAQEVIDGNRAAFVGFAKALHAVADDMLKAIDQKDAPALMNAGAALDEVCEGCHLKFWYPGQKIPPLPNEAPELKAGSKPL